MIQVPGLLIGSMMLSICTTVHESFACLSLMSSDGISLFAYPGMIHKYNMLILQCLLLYYCIGTNRFFRL